MLILGLGLIGLAGLSRPRFERIPKYFVTKEDFPELHNLVHRISKSLKISPPDFIVLNSEFNAAVSSVGIFQKKAIYIGLPFFMILDAQEKVALISHELAHFANNDPLRSVFISTTVNTLTQWYRIFHRDYFWNPQNGFLILISEFIINIFFHIVSFILYICIYIFYFLALAESQKAEYLADKLGAQISGKNAFVNLLEKSLLYPQVLIAIQRAALNKNSAGAMNEIKKEIQNFPPRQFERIKQIAALEKSTLDATHPPTTYRIKLLHKITDYKQEITLNSAKETAIIKEIEKLYPKINKKLEDTYHRSLYY